MCSVSALQYKHLTNDSTDRAWDQGCCCSSSIQCWFQRAPSFASLSCLTHPAELGYVMEDEDGPPPSNGCFTIIARHTLGCCSSQDNRVANHHWYERPWTDKYIYSAAEFLVAVCTKHRQWVLWKVSSEMVLQCGRNPDDGINLI